MGGGGSAYVVCAQLRGNFPFAESHDATAGQPIHRRINRMERVALAYGGNLVRRAGDMLLVSFATANAAALAACEMQRRCRGMPRLANFPPTCMSASTAQRRHARFHPTGMKGATSTAALALPWPKRSLTKPNRTA